MAITHADLAPTPKNGRLGSKMGTLLMVLNISFGLVCFILCVTAEATRSEMTEEEFECKYTGNGKLPLLSAAAAFFSLAMAMVVHHIYLLVVVGNSDSLLEVSRDYESSITISFTWQAGCFFVATWISFAVAEILMLAGLSVESGHLKNWSVPRESCLIVPQYMFIVAGVFGLVSICLACGLCNTLLRAEMYFNEQRVDMSGNHSD